MFCSFKQTHTHKPTRDITSTICASPKGGALFFCYRNDENVWMPLFPRTTQNNIVWTERRDTDFFKSVCVCLCMSPLTHTHTQRPMRIRVKICDNEPDNDILAVTLDPCMGPLLFLSRAPADESWFSLSSWMLERSTLTLMYLLCDLHSSRRDVR